jgi:hypothetical protein
MTDIRPEITHCGRTVSGDVVGIDIKWDGALAPQQSVIWSMFVTSEDGASEVHLGHVRSGDSMEQFVDDQSSGRRESVEPDADLSDDEIIIRFPANMVGVAVEWPVWKAVIAVDGQEVATRVVPVG